MTDDIWQRDEIESPCIKICTIHPETRVCLGCHRTLDEIGSWSRMTPDARRAVMAELATRAAQPGKRRGGRAARLQRDV